MSENDGGTGSGNAGGSGTVEFPAWMASLPDAHKQNPGFAQFKEAPQVWDKLDTLLKAEGKSVMIPGENATEEERIAFFKKIGRPEDADKYEVAKPTDWPADLPYDAEGEKWFKGIALKHNLTTAQAKGLFMDYMGEMKTRIASVKTDQETARHAEETRKQENREKAIGELKKEWPNESYQANLTLAQRAVEHFGGADLKQFFEDKPELGDSIPLIKVFAAIGKALGEDTLKGGSSSHGKPKPASGEIQYKTTDYGGPK
jgi:hypothetical protein